MRILHSSDVLVGLAFPHATNRAEELRAARMDSLRALLALASRERADFLLLAGNTLADNRIGHRDLLELVALLNTSVVPIYILPGLTDPYTPDSPYARRADQFKPPIHILTERKPVTIAGLTLLPFPVRTRSGKQDWNVDCEADLGVACASPPACPQGLKYIAMGGNPIRVDHSHAHWSGAPEGYGFGHGVGQGCLIELPASRPVAIGRYDWQGHALVEVGRRAEPEPEEPSLPGFRHPLLQSMEAGLANHDDPAVRWRALERLQELAAGHEDLV